MDDRHGWSTTNTFAWTPAQAGSNSAVTVYVRSVGSTSDTPERSAQRAFAITAGGGTVSGVSISANRVAPQAVGTTITWTATSTGGTAPHQYRWLTYNGTAWAWATGWSTSNTFAWTPTQASSGSAVSVYVRSAGNTSDTPERSAYATFAIQ